MSFNFGGKTGAGGGGFPFGTPSTTSTTQTGGFSFGAAPTGSTPGGFAFGATTTSATSTTGGFGGFGSGTAASTGATTGTAGGFGGFGSGTAASTGATTGTTGGFGGFGAGTAASTGTTTSTTGGFGGFGATPQASTGATTGTVVSFGGFGTPATTTGGFGSVATTSVSGGFGGFGGFGTANTTQQQTSAPTGGFAFAQKPTTTTTSGGFSFGTPSTQPAATKPQTGLTFGTPTTTQQTIGGFALPINPPSTSSVQQPLGTFAMPIPATQPQSTSISKPSVLGGLLADNTTTQTTSTGLQLGGSSATTTPSSAGFNLSSGQATQPQNIGFQFGQKTSAPTLATATTSTGVGIKLGGQTQTTSAPAAGFSFGNALKTSAPTLGTATTMTSGGSSTIKLGAPSTATSTGTGGLTLGGKPLGQPSTTPASTSAGLNLTVKTTATSAASLSTVTNTTASTSVPQAMNYRQLEEQINKWSLELEEQEKVFIQQATQVNAWDRLLIDNGDKISQLNTDVERVKLDQQRLDQELDFILAQQRELEELLVPLEQAVEQIQPIHYQQHADLEREHTYKLAENIDAQLKRMVQDLKEIIDHINSTNTNQDNNDPVQQIAKVLNAHMDSLQWIDQNSVLLQRRVDEVTKIAEQRKKEQERNFRLAYD